MNEWVSVNGTWVRSDDIVRIEPRGISAIGDVPTKWLPTVIVRTDDAAWLPFLALTDDAVLTLGEAREVCRMWVTTNLAGTK